MPVVADYIAVPLDIIKENVYVAVAIGIMYINKMDFVVSTAWRIRFVLAEYVNDRSKAMQMASIKIMNLSSKRIFQLIALLTNPEFEPM